jgi:hypothetical protein
MLSKGQKIALIVAGFVALAGGIGYLMFKNSGDGEGGGDEGGGNEGGGNEADSGSSGNPNSTNTTKPTTPTAEDILNEVVKKGSKGDGAKAVQFIINDVAGWRRWNGSTRKSTNGVNVKFPLTADGIFGAQSDAAARLIFDSYKNTGSITRHKARLKWAYSQGYYGKPLNSNLKNSSRSSEYLMQWSKGSMARK